MLRYLIFLYILLSSNLLIAQKVAIIGQAKSSQNIELDKQFDKYKVYEINVAEIIDALQNQSENKRFQLNLANDLIWDFNLIPNDIISKDYQKVEQTAFGKQVTSGSQVALYKGYLANDQQSNIRLSLAEDFIYGFIETNSTTYYIEPISGLVANTPKNLFIVYQSKDVKPNGGTCALHERDDHSKTLDRDHEQPGEPSSVLACYELEFAVAADFSMFQKFGGAAGAEAHVLGVLNNVSENYDDEFNHQIVFDIVTVFISDCASCDPWSSTTNAGNLLDSFTSWGNSGGFGVNHDVGELWTNRNLNGSTVGIAWLNGICNSGRYHVNQDFTSNANFLRVLTAHELGHNFAAGHDGSGSPFIMAPSVNNTAAWSTGSQNSINNFVSGLINSGCLTSCGTEQPPVAGFTANQTSGCAPLTVNFSDVSAGSPSSWSWSFPGATPSSSNLQNPTVTYNAPGVYNVTLQVTNSVGTDSQIVNAFITVTEEVNPFFTYSASDLTVVFNNQTLNATFYSWDFGDGNTSQQFNPIHTYANPGTYNVTLIAVGDCDPAVFSQTITVSAQPIAAFSADPDSGCPGLEVQFIDQSQNAEFWNWEFPGGTPSFSSQQFPLVTYNSPGIYPVTLTVDNASGSSTTNSNFFITVAESPSAGFFSNISNFDVFFNNTSINATSYQWGFGDGTSSNQANPTHTYAMDGDYTVVLVATNECGSDTFVQNVSISNAPQASFTSSNTIDCNPFTVFFTDQSSTNTTSWSWSFPGGNPSTSNLQNPVIVYEQAGTFSVTLIASNSAGESQVTQNDLVEISASPVPLFDMIIVENQVTFTNQSTNANTYSWDFGDGNNSSEENPIHTYSADGEYTVMLTASNSCGDFTYSENITISTMPEAAFGSDITNGCSPLTIRFIDLSTSNATAWSWIFPGGNPSASTEQNPVVVYQNDGLFDVSLSVSTDAGTSTLEVANFIEVRGLPVAVFSYSIDEKDVDFSNQSINAATYSWDFGDGNMSTEENPMHSYAQDGTYDVVLTATNECGSVSSQSSIEIITLPIAGFSSGNTSGCAPFEIQFSDQSSENAESRSWSFPGGNPATSTALNPAVQYETPGTYDVSLTVFNSLGQSTSTQTELVVISLLPTASFSYSQNGLQFDFTNTSTFGESYSWDFGDGNNSNEENPMHSFAQDGTYDVVLTATNECGTVSSQSSIEIITLPIAGFSSGNTSGCAPFEIQFSDQSSENAESRSWSFPGGNPATSTALNPTVQYEIPGTYDVSLTVFNSLGQSTSTQTELVVISSLPTASFSYSQNGLQFDFANTSTFGESYSWDFGDGNNSTEENPMHSFAQDGTYDVVLTATNECGTVSSQSSIEIITLPIAGFSSGNTSGCTPFEIQFSDQSSENAESRSWSFPGGNPATSTALNPTVQYEIPGTYDVSLTVFNSLGQSTSTQTELVVISSLPTASFNYSQNGLQFDFTNTSTFGESYSWDFGDGNNSTEENPMHSFAQDGTYDVVLTATNECGTVSSQSSIEVVTLPVAGFTSSNTSGCAPITIQFTDQSSINAESRSWSFPGGNPATSTDVNPTIQYETPGIYDVSLTVFNSLGQNTTTQSGLVVVSSLTSASFSFQQIGLQLDFTNTSTNAISYNWDFGDGSNSADVNPTHVYAGDGEYTVSLTATNDCGESVITRVLNIVTAPTAGFNASATTFCSPATVQFTDQSSSNTDTWQWSFPGGSPLSSNEQNPLVNYTQAGVYTVTLEVSNAAGNDTQTSEGLIQVVEVPSAGFTSTLNGFTVSFQNSSENATNYSWDFGDGNMSSAENPVHNYTEEGDYQASLTVSNSCGISVTSENFSLYNIPTAAFQSSQQEGCLPFTVNFEDMSSGAITSRIWTFEGGNPSVSTVQNPEVEYSVAGIFAVTLEVTSPGGTNSVTETSYITINGPATSEFNYTINGNVASFENNSQNGISYVWDFGDGITSTIENPNHAFSEDGIYLISLSTFNSCGTFESQQELIISTPPTAGFSISGVDGCAPFQVNFINNSSSNAAEYNWNFPGGVPETSTEENPVVIYQTAGIFSATLEVSNASGTDISSQTDIIEVGVLPLASFDYEILNDQVDFISTIQNQDEILWDFGDGNTSVEENPSHTYTESGLYTVSLTVFNECGENVFIEEIEIIIVTIPIANFGASENEGCGPLSVQFEDLSTENAESWMWTFEGGIPETSTEQNPQVLYEQAGSYDVTLTVSNSAGSNAFSIINYVFVDSLPTADFVFETNELTLELANQSMNASGWFWSFGDGTSSTLENPEYSYNEAGLYELELIATNDCGSDTLLTVVSVGQGVVAPQVAFTSDITKGCEPMEVQFSDQSDNNPDSWSWSFTGGSPATSTMQNPIVLYETPGIYEVSLTVSNTAGSDAITLSEYIVVEPLPEALFESVTVDGAVFAFTNNSNDATHYAWDFGDGNQSDEENPEHEYLESGDFTITLIATNDCGSDTITSSVNVLIVNTNDLESHFQFEIFPNPNNGNFQLKLEGKPYDDLQINAYNVLGQRVWAENLNFGGQLQMDYNFSYLSGGTYLFQIKTKEGQIHRKVIIQ